MTIQLGLFATMLLLQAALAWRLTRRRSGRSTACRRVWRIRARRSRCSPTRPRTVLARSRGNWTAWRRRRRSRPGARAHGAWPPRHARAAASRTSRRPSVFQKGKSGCGCPWPVNGSRDGCGPRLSETIMSSGAYVALSGLQARAEQLNRLAGDLANVNTAGYKAERGTTAAAERPSTPSAARCSRPSTWRRGRARSTCAPAS